MIHHSSISLFCKSQKIIDQELYSITITDAWITNKGGNFTLSNQVSQKHTMTSILSEIQAAGGRAPSELGGRHIKQSRENWLRQGRKTLISKMGVCTDLAAAAALLFLKIVEKSHFEAKIEIISTTKHAFVVVNREGELKSPATWGVNAFVIDIWLQNQYAPGKVAGTFWITDRTHSGAQGIFTNSHALREEICILQPTNRNYLRS